MKQVCKKCLKIVEKVSDHASYCPEFPKKIDDKFLGGFGKHKDWDLPEGFADLFKTPRV